MNKVIFVTNFLGNGGAARVMSILANRLIEENFTVEIISFLHRDGEYTVNKNIKIFYLTCKNKNSILKKIERIHKLRKILKKSENTTIISFEYFVNMQTIIANMFLKNKLIISERADPKFTEKRRGIKTLRNILYKYADCLVCQLQMQRNIFLPKYKIKQS